MLKNLLSEAVEEALAYAQSNKIEIVGSEVLERFSSHIAYNTFQSESFPILSLKGKNTRKHFHVTISRVEGKYETVCYAL